MKVLCVIPSVPSHLNSATVSSILQQTYPVDMILILPRKVEGKTVAERVSKVLNEGLSHVRLEDFDYLLRVDGDVVLPHNFLEENLKGKPDLCGGARHAMLIKVSPFLKLMNGKFHPKSDDSYTVYKFMKEGCRIKKRKVQPILLRQAGLHQGKIGFLNPSIKV